MITLAAAFLVGLVGLWWVDVSREFAWEDRATVAILALLLCILIATHG